jgi:hypothetical protein
VKSELITVLVASVVDTHTCRSVEGHQWNHLGNTSFGLPSRPLERPPFAGQGALPRPNREGPGD